MSNDLSESSEDSESSDESEFSDNYDTDEIEVSSTEAISVLVYSDDETFEITESGNEIDDDSNDSDEIID